MSDASQTKGAHHIGLTVPDIQETRGFFTDTLGFSVVAEKPDYPAVFVSDGTIMLTLWQASDPASAVPFDRKNVIGLHHFALTVDNAAALDAVHEKVRTNPRAKVEFAPEAIGDGPTRHMMCTIPGGIRMEFIAPAG